MYLENTLGGIFSFKKHNSRLLFINVLLLFHSHSPLSLSLSLSATVVAKHHPEHLIWAAEHQGDIESK